MLRPLFSSVVLCAAFLCSGCSSSQPAPAQPVFSSVDSLDLFLSRSSFTQTEFEQYRLSGSNLFHECGYLKGGRFYSKEQNFATVSPAEGEKLLSTTNELALRLKQGAIFDKPGKGTQFFDPGKCEISLKTPEQTYEVKTSLDSISEPTSSHETELRDVVAILRGAAGSNPCGNVSFYGLRSDAPRQASEPPDGVKTSKVDP